VTAFTKTMRRMLQCAALAGVAATAMPAPVLGEEGMRSLRSDSELASLLRRAKETDRRLKASGPYPPPPPPPAPVAAEAAAQPAPASAEPGITNVQTAGVDEGGIVKVHGDHLVVLRRGRLFTIDIRGDALRPVDRIDAFPPGASGSGAWYDEMLVTGDMVVVVGYSYARRGTEVNRFRISASGKLTYTDTHYLRSNDYYSADNYASRLIGTRLIFYTPLWVGDEATPRLPGILRWSEGGPKAGYERLATPSRIYVPDLLVNSPDAAISAFHSVTSCDLAQPRLDCSAVAVLGSWGRTFYVGQDAVYVWTGNLFQRRWDDRRPRDPRGLVYRIPLDGGRPGAAVVWGGPSDQFALRSEPDGRFHALVRSGYGGDAMWLNRRANSSAIALLTLRREQFGRGGQSPKARDYRPLPGGGEMSNIENRFIGDYVVYGANGYASIRKDNGWTEYSGPMLAYVVPLDSGMVTALNVGGTVSRIDRMGNDAILIGSGADGALRFQSVELGGGSEPAIVDSYDLPNSGEGESRSQAFFFRADNASGTEGVLGLPVTRRLEPRPGQAAYGSGIFYMTRHARRLSPAGQLDSAPLLSQDDGCEASCVDWYGNARPIFLRGRVFALMGYELVEGKMEGTRIREVRRATFMPDGGAGRR